MIIKPSVPVVYGLKPDFEENILAGEMTTSSLRFQIKSWFFWSPDKNSSKDWLIWTQADLARQEELSRLAIEPVSLPMAVRRRTTDIGRRLLEGALGCEKYAREACYVFASRHGEFSRAIKTLTAIAERETVSPAEFSMSVHHGLVGLLSIHTGNMEGHTALAAGADSFANGLLEAAGLIAENPDRPVLLLYADERLPEPYTGLAGHEDGLPFVAVLALEAEQPGTDAIELSFEPSELSEEDIGPANDFARFYLSGQKMMVSQGARVKWKWSRV